MDRALTIGLSSRLLEKGEHLLPERGAVLVRIQVKE
jgi:hypothetical protein